MKYTDPRSFLPLSPLSLQVLLSLAEEPRHGYAIMADIAERTEDIVTVRAGTMYLLLQRMLKSGLIAETDTRPHPDDDDERRRYYMVTTLGKAVASAEVRRLETIVSQARRRHVLGRK